MLIVGNCKKIVKESNFLLVKKKRSHWWRTPFFQRISSVLAKCCYNYCEMPRRHLFSVKLWGKCYCRCQKIQIFLLFDDLGVRTLSWWAVSSDVTVIPDGWSMQKRDIWTFLWLPRIMSYSTTVCPKQVCTCWSVNTADVVFPFFLISFLKSESEGDICTNNMFFPTVPAVCAVICSSKDSPRI